MGVFADWRTPMRRSSQIKGHDQSFGDNNLKQRGTPMEQVERTAKKIAVAGLLILAVLVLWNNWWSLVDYALANREILVIAGIAVVIGVYWLFKSLIVPLPGERLASRAKFMVAPPTILVLRPLGLLDRAISPSEAVKEELSHLEPGTMAVNVANQMRAYRRETLTVSIGTADRDKVVAAVGASLGQVVAKDIEVGTLMRVEVLGDTFTVAPQGPIDRPVVGDQPTVWQFHVTPTKSGTQTLTIQATVRVRLANTEAQELYPLQPQPQTIHVTVNVTCSLWHFLANKYVLFAGSTSASVLGYIFGLDAVKKPISDYIAPWLTWILHGIFEK